jgi:RNase adapter protein RapZ
MNEILLVTGMSGAGRSTVSAALEDLGWFVIDNLPVDLIPRVSDLALAGTPDFVGVVFIVGRSGRVQPDQLLAVLTELRAQHVSAKLLFLDAPDEVLITRFEGTRRRHPFPAPSVADAITGERQSLQSLRHSADLVIETGTLNSNQLRSRIAEMFHTVEGTAAMRVSLISFGYANGIPRDVDIVLDCRLLPNPHWIDELRPFTGLDEPVATYVLEQPDAQRFVSDVVNLLSWQIPAFAKEGKSYLSIAIGCTGGRHRSVAITEELSRRLPHATAVFHRDIDR